MVDIAPVGLEREKRISERERDRRRGGGDRKKSEGNEQLGKEVNERERERAMQRETEEVDLNVFILHRPTKPASPYQYAAFMLDSHEDGGLRIIKELVGLNNED